MCKCVVCASNNNNNIYHLFKSFVGSKSFCFLSSIILSNEDHQNALSMWNITTCSIKGRLMGNITTCSIKGRLTNNLFVFLYQDAISYSIVQRQHYYSKHILCSWTLCCHYIRPQSVQEHRMCLE